MDWSSKRKLTYGLAFFFFMTSLGVYLLRDTLFPYPTCSDKKQNGGELGVDCGGPCSLLCKEEIIPLSVVFAKVIESGPGMYDLVGMVSNKNVDNASRGLGYLFKVYDEAGAIIATTTGRTSAPMDGDFPIVVEGVRFDKEPKTVELALFDGYHFKAESIAGSPSVRILKSTYEGGVKPRVYAQIKNMKRSVFTNLPLIVLLYDEDNNVYAAGRTMIPLLDKEEEEQVSFVWNSPFKTAPAKIRIYPIIAPELSITR